MVIFGDSSLRLDYKIECCELILRLYFCFEIKKKGIWEFFFVDGMV